MKFFTRIFLILFLFLSHNILANNFLSPYSKEKFEQMNKAKQDFIVFVYATWCPKCRKEKNIIDKYLKDKKSANPILLLDYDTETSFREHHKIFSQGVLLHFQNGSEIKDNRYIHGTNKKKLVKFLTKTLNAK